MIKDKVIVFSNYHIQKNSGGPPGYIYKCIIDNLPSNVVLLQDVLVKNSRTLKTKFRNKINYLTSLVYDNKRNNHVIKYINANCFNYKYIYFHDVFTLYKVLHLLSNKQVVILQSHSPELPSEELYDINKDLTQLKKNRQIEKKSFERANVLVFPNKECKILYNKLINENHNIKYLLTGIKEIKSKINYPISQDKINLLFIGRRNDVKGFNSLIEVFKKVTKKRKDLRLFIAGGGEKIYGDNIYDLGMITTAYDWINSVDFVFSLNQQSYFDLNVIETICLGTPLIMTTTEGHEFFKNKDGIIDVTTNSLEDVLLSEKIISKNYKKEHKLILKAMYDEFFTGDKFKDRLENVCMKVINEK
ncbi:glycosyltransferase involved in cell wall biosynthesis [Wenyingzhuangia heitensis]|uniref:Glycosyltransferase involved in cell wall biosynthesis n=1 Tax=Wenyingzhuangia heitensis TaxID=1487859 RepID=A0ABX0U9B1_9FLAO|nr:glycosyltransferase [Wenyingzhuangia heitensis]NIJ45424.1 glycosyltransferase involved in cell wall biosynthesis [Wenyingzhuangia heitensis]